MKKYEQIEMIVIPLYSSEDIIKTSSPDDNNALPWVDLGLDDDFNP